MFESRYSFINGVIAGAAIALSIMSIAFLQMTGPLEGKVGFATTETRIAIFMGFIVFIIALLYEIYRKKDEKQTKTADEFKQSSNHKDNTR